MFYLARTFPAKCFLHEARRRRENAIEDAVNHRNDNALLISKIPRRYHRGRIKRHYGGIDYIKIFASCASHAPIPQLENGNNGNIFIYLQGTGARRLI